MTVVHGSEGNPISVNDDGSQNIQLTSSNVIQPIDVQSRLQTTIQTHNAVSVALSSSSEQTSWIDCDGFIEIALTMLNDGVTNSSLNVYWSNDGTNKHGFETVVATSAVQYKAGSVPIKARYAKVRVDNGDAGAAHTMSAWAYLKA
jgi:hypothetical protein